MSQPVDAATQIIGDPPDRLPKLSRPRLFAHRRLSSNTSPHGVEPRRQRTSPDAEFERISELAVNDGKWLSPTH